jgi:hypothetical protein
VASEYRDFPGRRSLVVVLRAVHLVGLVGVGAAVLGGQPLHGTSFLVAMVGSGIGMMLADLWMAPGYLIEVAGLTVLVKLALLVWLILDPAHRLPLFWLILVLSATIAHAPGKVRHYRFVGAARQS